MGKKSNLLRMEYEYIYNEKEDKYNPINWERGKTIYCILRHVSQSGMMRIIDLYTIIDNELVRVYPKNKDGCKDTNFWYKFNYKKEGYRVDGCGMDMGFSLVYDLGRYLLNDGYYFKHKWI